MRRVLSGLLGGAVGSAAMSSFMKQMHRRLPPEDRYPLPPRQIAMTLAEKSGVGQPRREDDRKALTLLAHYAYGTALGAVYSMMAPRTRWAPIVGGVPFGLAAWTVSYLGWLPAVGPHPPATQESAPRNALMIASHVVWAGTIAACVEAFGNGSLADERPFKPGSR
jgi:uncharacterized membrane protein YagU involved in acid resistance